MLTIFKTKKTFLKKDRTPQILDLLQLSRKERECKNISLRSIRQFGAWKKRHEHANDSSLKIYAEIEGILLRRQAQDAILFYKLIRQDRMRAFHDYMEKLPSRNSILRVVS